MNIIEDTGIQKISSYLDSYKVTVVCGGGIAAVEIPRLLRELRRHGATTQVCVTENCLKFVGIESMRWASQSEVIMNPSGLSEHICTSDAIIVSPATADLISKIRHGICSDGATTFVQSALGLNKPVIFCQTMHDSLANSPIIQENIHFLKKLPNVFFIKPRQEEGKQKIPDVETLAMDICHLINKQTKKIDEHILITYGGTRVMLDPVRCITNLSTGALGIEVAKLFYGMGYELTVLAANTMQKSPSYENLNFHYLPDYNDMLSFANAINPKKYDGLIHLVAASDFVPETYEKNKINSGTEKITIKLMKTKKLLTHTKLKDIAYKAAAKLTTENGIKKATELLDENKLDAVFWSTAQDAWHNGNTHTGIFISKNKNKTEQQKINNKKQIAQCYFKAFVGKSI